MLRYDTRLPFAPPVTQQGIEDAVQGMKIKSPYKGYGSAHQDTLDWMGDNNAANYRQSADRANFDYAAKQQAGAREMALQGLQQMSQAQQNEQGVQNSRLQNMIGVIGGPLGGLYG